MKKLAAFLFCALVIASCKKEKSIDRTGGGGDPTTPSLGNNCSISQIANIDTTTKTAWEAHNLFFNTSGQVIRSEVFDSIGLAPYADDSYTYRGDTALINNGTNGYFVRNSAGRVILYRGPEDPTDPTSEDLDITFTYSAAGYLTKVDYAFTAFPTLTLLRSAYTYTGNNLTKAITETFSPAAEIVVDADLSYSSQPVRDFIYTFPDAYFYVNHLPAFNFGNKSANALSKITTRYYDNGVAIDSAVTNYKNYKLSNDGYVLEFFADGDWQDGMGLYYEFTRFKYLCR
jgi:hypothetical protein